MIFEHYVMCHKDIPHPIIGYCKVVNLALVVFAFWCSCIGDVYLLRHHNSFNFTITPFPFQPTSAEVNKMKVPQLRDEMKRRNLLRSGNKSVLQSRLLIALGLRKVC